ncbi:metal-dependent hydrolase family protein [Listeria kieliensis]
MTKTKFKNAQVFTGNGEQFEQIDFGVDESTGRLFFDLENHSFDTEKDLGGRFVMPGLINCHTHVVLDPFFKIGGLSTVSSKEAEAVRGTFIALDNIQKSLKHGVTYLRDCGSSFDIDIKLSQLEKEGHLFAPGIIGSGPALVMTGGHGVELGLETDGPDEMRRNARRNIKNGARNIKMMATGGVSVDGEKPTDVQLSEEEMRVAVEEAHHKGYTACAHAQGTEGIKNAIRAGVDSIEHGVYLDDESIQMLLDHGTFVVPTLIAPYAINQHPDVLPEFMVAKSVEISEAHFESIGKAAKAGVKLALGTDSGTAYNDFENSAAFEMELMVRAGVTPLQALQAASKNAAELLKIDQETGTLENGKLADFLVLKENPLEDIRAVQGEKDVYKKGKLV